MTLDDVNRLLRHWAKYPPLRDLVAAFIGFEVGPGVDGDEPQPAEQKYMTAEDMQRLMAMTGGRIPGMS